MSNSAGYQQPLIEQWNGTRWSIQPSATIVNNLAASFSGIACPSPSTCFAVGRYKSMGSQGALIEELSGTTWTVNTRGSGGPSAELNGVSCAGTSCYAVGEYADTVLTEAWTGVGWALLPSPTPSLAVPQAVMLNGISCISPAACFAVGSWTDFNDNNHLLIEQLRGLALTITAASPRATVGSLIAFDVTITNTTSSTLTGVSVVDPLPGGPGVDWVIATQTGALCSLSGSQPTQTLMCSAAQLAKGADYVISVTSTTTNASGGAYTNTVVATAKGCFPVKVSQTIMVVAGSGVISTIAGGLGSGPPLNVAQDPLGVAVGPSGYLYATDYSHGVIRTIGGTPPTETVAAGNGQFSFNGSSGDGGPASAAELGNPWGVTVDSSGNVIFADYSQAVRVVAASTGTFYGVAMTAGDIYTVAGNGTAGFSGDGGPATAAELARPSGVALDPEGNLVIADFYNDRVRVVAASTGTFYGVAMNAGDIYTVAGNGAEGYAGDGGTATAAELQYPLAVAVDAAGDLMITDYSSRNGHDGVRMVAARTGTFYGVAMTTGDIYTIAGNGTEGFSGDGGPATAAALSFPFGVALDTGGNLIIADNGNGRVRVVAATSGSFYGVAMTVGDIYTVAGGGGVVGNGGPALDAAVSPYGITVDATGNVLIADGGNAEVRVVATKTGTFYGVPMIDGNIYAVAGDGTVSSSGDGGAAIDAELSPVGVAVDGASNSFIADPNSDNVRMVAVDTGSFYGVAMTAGDIYTVAGDGVGGFSGDGGPATAAELSYPTGVAVDASRNLIINDANNDRVRVVAASTGTFYGVPMTAGDIYTVAGNGTYGFSGDGVPATGAALTPGYGIAVDLAGNLVIAENERVQVVAASTGSFYGIAMIAGDIYTVAGNGTQGFAGDGGPATAAELITINLAVDSAGNIVIADYLNQRIRVVAAVTGTFYGVAMTAGDIYTVAGNGVAGFSGDGGAATAAAMNTPISVAVDNRGNLAITDFANERVRMVAAVTGTFYGVAMTAGDIYTVAGNGAGGFAGDGGPAVAAELNAPRAIAVDAAGDLIFVDESNYRVRKITGP